MATNNNADDYAAARQNIWFTAHNQTPADGNLTGQCVTLEKWFLNDMSSVPAPFSARGHGKDVGRTLVNQGHAVEVPFAKRRRGDIICYEFGTYGHVAIQLSGGRVFESNVNWTGVQSKVIDGERVYASRIGSENEAWRVGKNPHVYRLKTYIEGGVKRMIENNDYWRGFLRIIHSEIGGWDLHKTHAGEYDKIFMDAWYGKTPDEAVWTQWTNGGAYRAAKEAQKKAVVDLTNSLNGSRGEVIAAKKAVDEANARVAEEVKKATEAGKKALELEAQIKADQETGNSFLRWLGSQLNKLIGGK